MKTFKTSLLTIATLLSSITATAHDFIVDGIYYNIVSETDLTVEVTHKGEIPTACYGEYEGDLVIPESVNYNELPYSVTRIGSSAFRDCVNLTSVTIPQSIRVIGSYVFENCSNLTMVTIPDLVKSLGESAFVNCTNLTNIIIGKLVTSIEGNTFGNCSSLTNITIGKSVTSIGNSAFSGCTNLTSITIPNSVTSIGNYTFNGCTALKELHIEDGTTTLSLGYKQAGTYGQGLFYDCPLETLYLGRNLSYKTSYAYGYSPFRHISTLSLIVLGKSVTRIGENAFYYDNRPTKYCCFGEESPSIASSSFSKSDIKDDTLYVLEECVEMYKATTPWSEFGEVRSLTHSLTYVLDGMEYETIRLKYCDPIEKIEVPYKEGYTFSGWTDDFVTMPLQDVILSGTYIPNVYKVTYLVNGECYLVDSVTYNTTLKIPDLPEKEGHTFSGWDKVPEVMPAHDVTISGSLLANSYKVHYVVDGELFDVDSILYGTNIPIKDIPIKEGYTFSGWSKTPETMPAQDITIDGTFTINTYKLTYLIDDKVYMSSYVTYGDAIYPMSYPTKEGHTFTGWGDLPETMPANDVTVGGTFLPNKHKVVYKVDGEVYATDTTAYGETIVLREVLTKEGHTFSGWSEVPTTMPDSDVTVEGSFTVNSYTLSYLVDGEEYKKAVVKYGTELVPEALPEKEGYTFSGWSEIPTTMPANDVTIEGTFTINSYTLSYLVNGEVYKTMQVEYGATIIPETFAEQEGYTFSGWSEVPETMPAKDVTIEGTFTANKYQVVYVVDGTEYAKDSVTYGEAIVVKDVPTKEGHTFSGWSEVPATMPAKDVVIEGTFTVNTYKLTYMVDGMVYMSSYVTYGDAIFPMAELTKEGYTFSWSEIPATMPANDVTVEGSFTINSYTLLYTVDGEEYKIVTVEYGAEIVPEAEPVKEGYTFSGWSEIPATMPAHDVTIEGTFTKVDGVEVVLTNKLVDVYTLQGVKIREQIPVESLKNELPRGIYIVNGKKVMVR